MQLNELTLILFTHAHCKTVHVHVLEPVEIMQASYFSMYVVCTLGGEAFQCTVFAVYSCLTWPGIDFRKRKLLDRGNFLWENIPNVETRNDTVGWFLPDGASEAWRSVEAWPSLVRVACSQMLMRYSVGCDVHIGWDLLLDFNGIVKVHFESLWLRHSLLVSGLDYQPRG